MRRCRAPGVVLAVLIAPLALFGGCSSDESDLSPSGGNARPALPGTPTGDAASTTNADGSGTVTGDGSMAANPDGAATTPDGAPKSDASTPPTNVDAGPPPGNPSGNCVVPNEAQAESTANPKTVVGSGTAASCTSQAFVTAVAAGGVITFNCGAAPVTITLAATATVYNNTGPVVIDGGGKVTLSGGGARRILYMNACDPSHGGYSSGVSGDCNEQVTPKLTLQNLDFVDGNVQLGNVEAGGGGAIYVRGGRTKIVNSRFFNNQCDTLGSDVGGGAIRILDFPAAGSVNRPVYIVNSTFGSAGLGNKCANGGALSSIGTSWSIYNSLFANNLATGMGANDGNGGNGGAIYNDGNTIALKVCGTSMHDNFANEGGSAIFFVSNDQTGTIAITDSTLKNHAKGTFETAGLPGLFVIANGPTTVTNSTITR
jgi:hypothetical protein